MVNRSIIETLHSSDIQGDQREGESGVTQSINMNFLIRISKQIKYKAKAVLLEMSLMNFILVISK